MEITYIASDKRAGSTMLDYLLGNADDANGVGELCYIQSHVLQDGYGQRWDWKCSCGEHLQDCSFWKPVLGLYQERGGDPEKDDALCSGDGMTKFQRILILTALILRSKFYRGWVVRKVFLDRTSLLHGCNHANYLQCVSDVHGRHVVDSSKTARQLSNLIEALSDGKGDRIRVIHMIRDSRAAAWSKVKHQGGSKSLSLYLRVIMSWVSANASIRLVLEHYATAIDSLSLQYEDLCEDLSGGLTRLSQFTGLSIDASSGSLNKESKHNIGGSPSRLDLSRNCVALDVRWLEHYRMGHRIIYYCLVWPFLGLLGCRRHNRYKTSLIK